ncbi:MAG: hypothetical protein WA125_14050 [Desulfosporosinus sp.]
MVAGIDKPEKITSKELIVLIQPDGLFKLDWRITEEKMESSQFDFQEEVYRRYRVNAHEALSLLGFSERTAVTSESLRYLRLLAAAFVQIINSIKSGYRLYGGNSIIQYTRFHFSKTPFLLNEKSNTYYDSSHYIRF